MPRVLFLDDDPVRIKKFRSAHPYATITESATECISQLSEQDWDVVCLDHDLGGKQHVDSALSNTGAAVVRWIEINKPKVQQFFVHSLNTGAANQMVIALKQNYECRYIPFGFEFINTVYDAVMYGTSVDFGD